MILKLTTNVPVVIALKYDAGVRKDSGFTRSDGTPAPPQIQYTLTTNDVLYVPQHLGDQIFDMGIRRLMPFEICKTQAPGQKTITWKVRLIDSPTCFPETQQPVTTPAAAPVATVPVSHQQNGTAAASPRGSQHNGHTNGNTDPFRGFNETAAGTPAMVTSHIVNADGTVTRGYSNGHAAPIIHTKASAAMAGALIASIDAWRTAMEYAAAKGFPLTPTSEDVRAVANTLVINAQRAGGAQ